MQSGQWQRGTNGNWIWKVWLPLSKVGRWQAGVPFWKSPEKGFTDTFLKRPCQELSDYPMQLPTPILCLHRVMSRSLGEIQKWQEIPPSAPTHLETPKLFIRTNSLQHGKASAVKGRGCSGWQTQLIFIHHFGSHQCHSFLGCRAVGQCCDQVCDPCHTLGASDGIRRGMTVQGR